MFSPRKILCNGLTLIFLLTELCFAFKVYLKVCLKVLIILPLCLVSCKYKVNEDITTVHCTQLQHKAVICYCHTVKQLPAFNTDRWSSIFQLSPQENSYDLMLISVGF